MEESDEEGGQRHEVEQEVLGVAEIEITLIIRDDFADRSAQALSLGRNGGLRRGAVVYLPRRDGLGADRSARGETDQQQITRIETPRRIDRIVERHYEKRISQRHRPERELDLGR